MGQAAPRELITFYQVVKGDSLPYQCDLPPVSVLSWVSSHCTRCCAKLKISSQRQLPSKTLVKFGKNYNQFGPREPDRLPLCCRSHCSPFQCSGLVQIQSKQFSITRLIYECGDSRWCLPLCVWLRAVLQAWRHVKPV